MNGARAQVRPAPARRCFLALLIALAAGTLAAGCASPRNALGTRASSCFKSIPVARRAVHDAGRFGGVRYIGSRALARFLERSLAPAGGVPRWAVQAGAGLCVVSFSGRFSAASVERGVPSGARGDRLALVVVRTSDQHLIATILLPGAVGLTHDVA